MTFQKPIKIAITAMGGQGGGVLSTWIVKLAEQAGYITQYTSVPGVAQRTGATVYYVEIFPGIDDGKTAQKPVLAMMPVPGDVDVVLSAEMMEAGRALQRGFVSGRTTLIASSHRVYSIYEKIAMGDGRGEHGDIIETGQRVAKRFICFDMDVAAQSVGSVISSVLFGALAGSGALPFSRQAFEDTIRAGGKAVESNLAGFELGFSGAHDGASEEQDEDINQSEIGDVSPKVADLLLRMRDDFPPTTHGIIKEGLKRVVDYQDNDYGHLYLDRLQEFAELDKQHGGDRRVWRLTKDVARYLALAMSYEDTIRVAELKVRDTRFDRVREEIRAEQDQYFHITEFFHPRIQEICDILPAGLGAAIMNGFWKDRLGRFLTKGRRITTSKLPGFLLLYFVSSWKFMRRSSYRYALEEKRIAGWIDAIKNACSEDYILACELAGLQRLIKGYGETHERGLRNYHIIMDSYQSLQSGENANQIVIDLKDTALRDEDGEALNKAIASLAERSEAA